MNSTLSKINRAQRAFLITDTHIGLRNGSQEWLQIVKEYFYDFFIPLLKKEKQENDIVIHCGDVFDSRHSLNLFALNTAMEIFEEIAKIMPIVIILGNHDIAKKNSNDVNSVKVLKWIPNIHVIEEPEVITIANKKFLFMPWRAGHNEELECINNNPADFLFCHTDVQGLKFNKSTTIESGLDLKELKRFRKVYAGHIHYAQQKGNFRMLGCPYPMTRSDINNEKGIWRFDIENESEHYYANIVSPKFLKMTFEKLLDTEEDDAKTLMNNNFVDVMVDPKWSLNFPFSTFSEDMKGFRRLDFVPQIDSIDDELEIDTNAEMDNIDILELSSRLIYNTQHSDSIKDKLLATVKHLYDRVQKTQDIKDEA